MTMQEYYYYLQENNPDAFTNEHSDDTHDIAVHTENKYKLN